jgi:hypothetical protein
MTSDEYTRLWFKGGKFRHWIAACYLGYRESDYGRVASALWLVPNFACLAWDWIKVRVLRMRP